MDQAKKILVGKWEGIISIRTLVAYKEEISLEGKYELTVGEDLKGSDIFQDEQHEVEVVLSDEEGIMSIEFTSGTNVKMNGILNLKGASISGVTVGPDSQGTFSIQKK